MRRPCAEDIVCIPSVLVSCSRGPWPKVGREMYLDPMNNDNSTDPRGLVEGVAHS